MACGAAVIIYVKRVTEPIVAGEQQGEKMVCRPNFCTYVVCGESFKEIFLFCLAFMDLKKAYKKEIRKRSLQNLNT